jgi:cytochrome c-type biogenesis protein CcmH/NrfF
MLGAPVAAVLLVVVVAGIFRYRRRSRERAETLGRKMREAVVEEQVEEHDGVDRPL